MTVIERPTRGQLLVHNKNLVRLPRWRVPYYRRELGVVFQDNKLLTDRSVFDNVALPLVASGVSQRDIPKRVRAVLDMVGLLGKEKLHPLVLSGGEQQRVGIARALVNRPPLLLADEPTGNLDLQLSTAIFDLFHGFNQHWRHRADRHPRPAPGRASRQTHAHAQGRRTGARHGGGRMNYLLRHAQVLLATLGQMARAPFATLLTLTVIGITLALPSGLYVMLDNLERLSAGWDRGAQASLFLKRNVTEAGAHKLAQKIRAMSSVAGVDYISREAALAEFRKLSGFGTALNALDSNPLPAVLVVRLSVADNPAAVESLMTALAGLPGVDWRSSTSRGCDAWQRSCNWPNARWQCWPRCCRWPCC